MSKPGWTRPLSNEKLLRRIHEHSADGLDTSLIVGAGTGSQLGDWRQLGCRQLLLAEAHPRLAEELGRRLRHDQGNTCSR